MQPIYISNSISKSLTVEYGTTLREHNDLVTDPTINYTTIIV